MNRNWKAEVIAGCGENDAIEDGDDTFSRSSGEVDVCLGFCIRASKDGGDSVKAAEATFDEENFVGLELHGTSEIGVGRRMDMYRVIEDR